MIKIKLTINNKEIELTDAEFDELRRFLRCEKIITIPYIQELKYDGKWYCTENTSEITIGGTEAHDYTTTIVDWQ